tara:strand:+ start:32665 stop:32955 length:291 start_codon:yes stop_codon:yes gene_type:complete
MPKTTRDILIKALIEQELSTMAFEELLPEIPVDATPSEALSQARSKLEQEYALISLSDLESLYRIFIMESDVDSNLDDDGTQFFEVDDMLGKLNIA